MSIQDPGSRIRRTPPGAVSASAPGELGTAESAGARRQNRAVVQPRRREGREEDHLTFTARASLRPWHLRGSHDTTDPLPHCPLRARRIEPRGTPRAQRRTQGDTRSSSRPSRLGGSHDTLPSCRARRRRRRRRRARRRARTPFDSRRRRSLRAGSSGADPASPAGLRRDKSGRGSGFAR
jgi:hypothetical protein